MSEIRTHKTRGIIIFNNRLDSTEIQSTIVSQDCLEDFTMKFSNTVSIKRDKSREILEKETYNVKIDSFIKSHERFRSWNTFKGVPYALLFQGNTQVQSSRDFLDFIYLLFGKENVLGYDISIDNEDKFVDIKGDLRNKSINKALGIRIPLSLETKLDQIISILSCRKNSICYNENVLFIGIRGIGQDGYSLDLASNNKVRGVDLSNSVRQSFIKYGIISHTPEMPLRYKFAF